MEPTARAEALLLPLREILHDIEQTFSPRAARPRPVRGVLRIGAHTYVEYVMMPSLLGRLQQQAPNLRIHMVPLNADYESQLDEGVISMVISKQDEVPTFRRIPLFEDKLICAAHRSHPLQGQVLCIESFAQAQHLLVAPRGSEGGIVDDLLAAHGMTRHTPLIVQSFLAAPSSCRARLCCSPPRPGAAPADAAAGSGGVRNPLRPAHLRGEPHSPSSRRQQHHAQLVRIRTAPLVSHPERTLMPAGASSAGHFSPPQARPAPRPTAPMRIGVALKSPQCQNRVSS